jgi:hypothetical protein
VVGALAAPQGLMARRRRRGGEVAVDLFSFLNIMAATIGVQTLLIVIMALQIKPGDQTVQFLPTDSGGNRAGKQANYVLCQGKGQLELVGPGIRQTVNRGDPQLDRFLDGIAKAREPQYLVIGVRPDAFRDFEWVRRRAEQRRISLGYEPIDADWKVTLPVATPAVLNP